jgi:hypothetical protein
VARDIGLVPCTTPIQSPQSNGIAEAFVKTIKRDYARVSAKPDAANVLHQLDSWFAHYNRVHPHKALGYRSPREFRKQMTEKATEEAVGSRPSAAAPYKMPLYHPRFFREIIGMGGLLAMCSKARMIFPTMSRTFSRSAMISSSSSALRLL